LPEKPHIIYVLSDEHRGQAMGWAGDRNVRTPAMDRLAATGAGFQRAYTNSPICVASRATIFSGRHAHAAPVSAFFDTWKAAAPSTATILRDAGYHTCYIGKWHLALVRDQNPPAVQANRERFQDCALRTPEQHRGGFQDWFAYEAHNQHIDGYYYHQHDLNPTPVTGYITDVHTDQAIDYVKQYDRDEPLCMVMSVCPPHFPLRITDEWLRHDPAALEVRPNFEDTPEYRENLARYYAMIENLDWNLGRLVDAVRATPGFEDAIVVYFSDHGDFLGSHGFRWGKERPHEESVRVPVIFNQPGVIPEQGAVPGLFSLVDMLPTTLGLAGVPIPDYCQGTDWSAHLRGEHVAGPDEVLLEMQGNPRHTLHLLDWRGLVTDRWKYAFFETGDELLFDLETDPYEQTNLAAGETQTAQAMRQRLLDLLAEMGEPYFHILMQRGVTPVPQSVDASEAKG